MKNNFSVSVIVTTYNWSSALKKVVTALMQQDDKNFELIIADDGSTNETKDCIQELSNSYNFPLRHIWQEDEGFRAAKIRNKAVAAASTDYLIFLDGDCVPLPHFIRRHKQLAEQGWLIAGNRMLLSQQFSAQILADEVLPHQFKIHHWLLAKTKSDCNRISPVLTLPFLPRKLQPTKWQGVKTCNLGLWKQDFINVNGFDEAFSGWGYEDSDLVIRLYQAGIKRKDGRFMLPVLHLWHKEQDRNLEQQNLARFEQRLQCQNITVESGINQYIMGI